MLNPHQYTFSSETHIAPCHCKTPIIQLPYNKSLERMVTFRVCVGFLIGNSDTLLQRDDKYF
jgi:hypothetical protein